MHALRAVIGPLLLGIAILFAALPARAGSGTTTAAFAEAVPSAAVQPALREIGSWQAARELSVELSAGSVRIVPGASDRVRVLAPVATDDENVDLRAKYTTKNGTGRLAVRARDELVVTIEVPPSTALDVQMSAGELHVGPIGGDKDLRLSAGQLVLQSAESDRDADVRLRVTTGEITWQGQGVQRGGLFRSYARDGSGPKVRARVTAGELRVI